MQRIIASAVLALAAALPQPTNAQDFPVNPNVTFKYVEPELTPTYERLKGRKVLEALTQFLSPLRLKRPLTITTDQCNTNNAFYIPGRRTVTMCYEMVRHFADDVGDFVEGKLYFNTKTKKLVRASGADTIALKPRVTDISRGEASLGSFLSVMFHELGHAVFHIQEIPILGREEDAADQMAGFILVQFGKELARTTIKGAIARRDMGMQLENYHKFPYHDEHSTSSQRLAILLCIGYGYDRATFQDFVDAGLIPTARAENCESEYAEVRSAFRATVLPAIDQELMEKVRSRQWVVPEEWK